MSRDERKIALAALDKANAEFAAGIEYIKKNFPDVYQRGISALFQEMPKPAEMRKQLEDAPDVDSFVQLLTQHGQQTSDDAVINLLARGRNASNQT